MAQKGKPAPQSKPQPQASDPTVAALQEELKREGFLIGPVDGKMGKTTQDAIQARDAKKAQDAELELKRAQVKNEETKAATDKVKSDAEANALLSDTARKKRYDEQASSGWGLATQTAANTLTPMLATAGGVIAGGKINTEMDRGQEGRNKTLRGAAADRVSGLTTRDGARTGVRLAGAMPNENALLRVGSRMAPHLALGGIGIGKGMQVLNESDPNGEFYSQMADRAAGLGWIGAGTGIMKQGIRYAASPGVSPDAQALAIINSNQLRRNAQNRGGMAPQGDPDGSAPRRVTSDPPRAGTERAIRAQARELQIPGRSTMGKADLANAVADALKEQGGKRAKRLPKAVGAVGPALAAGLAYAATPDQAQAADGSASGVNTSALTNAAGAGGIAYGVQRGIEALPSAVGGAARMVGEAVAPVTIDTMTDYSPDELAQARNWAARNLPEAMQFGAVDQARQMATVPEPSPMRGQIAPSEMAGIDQGEAPDFDSQMAELEALLGQIGAAQEPGPVANAVQSQRVASMPQQQTMYQPQMPQRNALLR